MKEREEIIKGSAYWLTKVQIQAFNLLSTYMDENDLTREQVAEQLKVSLPYVGRVLNGNFNFSISRLVELVLLVGKAPVIRFETIEQILKAEAAQKEVKE